MIRELLAAGAIAAAALSTAPLAAADPGPMYPDTSGRYAGDVPGMDYDAHLAAPCVSSDIFTFGRGRGGEPLQCRGVPNQRPPLPTPFWQSSYELRGVQNIGTPCPGPQTAAQAPDGRPLICFGTRGWQPGFLDRNGYHPT
jgi:hypothetical protein